MASIREKLQRVHAPRPTEAPAAADPRPAAAAPAVMRPEPVREPAPPVPVRAPSSAAGSAPRVAPSRPVAGPAEPPLPEERGDRIRALQSRLDRVFNPSMKAAAKRAEERGEEVRGLQPREVVVVPTDEPVMRPRKRAAEKVADGPAERAPRRAAAKPRRGPEPVSEVAAMEPVEPLERRPRRPLVMEPVAFDEGPPRPAPMVARSAAVALPLPVATEGVATAETRHRWQGLRSEVMQARASNDEARALALLGEMAALPSTDAWPHVELARYYETVAHDYARALAHIRIALARASWNGGYKSQLARLEAKLRRS